MYTFNTYIWHLKPSSITNLVILISEYLVVDVIHTFVLITLTSLPFIALFPFFWVTLKTYKKALNDVPQMDEFISPHMYPLMSPIFLHFYPQPLLPYPLPLPSTHYLISLFLFLILIIIFPLHHPFLHLLLAVPQFPKLCLNLSLTRHIPCSPTLNMEFSNQKHCRPWVYPPLLYQNLILFLKPYLLQNAMLLWSKNSRPSALITLGLWFHYH